MLNPSNDSSAQEYRQQPLRLLLNKHPFVFWSSLWLVIVLLGSGATIGLLSPGPTEKERPKPTPAPVTVEVSKPKEDLPLSLFAAIATGCGVGSLLFAYVLKRGSTQSRYPSRRLKSVSTVGKKRRRPPKRRPSISRTPQPGAMQPSFQSLDTRQPSTDARLTQVTVLPPEESHPLDRGDESLADLLDLRRHKSLASLMRDR
jgi:hypothetical protein